ncbi:MAG TPA: hypothetical protein VFO05_08475 [Candidatus Limnocylindrales bacterium]|nr:hypothetical protein [Candidatus Limnocylindrales bacterium]
MVEYGQGISGGAGQVSGSGGGGGGGGVNGDWGAAIGQAVNDAATTISAMPPWQLALIVVVIIGGLIILKRAF